MDQKWINRFFNLIDGPNGIASWSKDPSTKVGAIIVRPDRVILSHGYNGFPRGVDDSEELLKDRDYKYPRIVHAEMNAIFNCGAPSMQGCHIFVSPVHTCSHCAQGIIQTGIKYVHIRSHGDPRWEEFNKPAKEMFEQAGVIQKVYRHE